MDKKTNLSNLGVVVYIRGSSSDRLYGARNRTVSQREDAEQLYG